MVYYNDIDGYCCAVLRHNIAAGNLYEGTVDARSITEIDPGELRGYGQIHLFAGIGGFPLGFGWAGMPATFSILTGGFPCQPFSVAGKRRGTEDDRALWPEMRRVIGGVRPRWVVCENVPGIVNMELRSVLSDLETEGYTVEPPLVLPACGLNARHRRERVWIVAHTGYAERPRWDASPEGLQYHEWRETRGESTSCGGNVAHSDTERQPQPEGAIREIRGRTEYGGEDVAHTCGARLQVGSYDANRRRGVWDEREAASEGRTDGIGICARLPESGLGGNAHGIPARLDAVAPLGAEQYPWEPPRVTKERENRGARIKALGNAIVPQLAMMIGLAIMEYVNFTR